MFIHLVRTLTVFNRAALPVCYRLDCQVVVDSKGIAVILPSTSDSNCLAGANHVVARGMLAAHTPAVCRCVRVHVPSAALRRSSSAGKQPRDKAAEEPEEPEEPEGPEYIPRRKAKNPMRNIGYAW